MFYLSSATLSVQAGGDAVSLDGFISNITGAVQCMATKCVVANVTCTEITPNASSCDANVTDANVTCTEYALSASDCPVLSIVLTGFRLRYSNGSLAEEVTGMTSLTSLSVSLFLSLSPCFSQVLMCHPLVAAARHLTDNRHQRCLFPPPGAGDDGSAGGILNAEPTLWDNGTLTFQASSGLGGEATYNVTMRNTTAYALFTIRSYPASTAPTIAVTSGATSFSVDEDNPLGFTVDVSSRGGLDGAGEEFQSLLWTYNVRAKALAAAFLSHGTQHYLLFAMLTRHSMYNPPMH